MSSEADRELIASNVDDDVATSLQRKSRGDQKGLTKVIKSVDNSKTYAKNVIHADQKKMSKKLVKLNKRIDEISMSEKREPTRRLSYDATADRNRLGVIKEKEPKTRRASDIVRPMSKKSSGSGRAQSRVSKAALKSSSSSSLMSQSTASATSIGADGKSKPMRARKRTTIEAPTLEGLDVVERAVNSPDISLLPDKMELAKMEQDNMHDIRKKMANFMGHQAYEEKGPQRKASHPRSANEDTLAVNYNRGRRLSIEGHREALPDWMGLSEEKPKRKISPNAMLVQRPVRKSTNQ